MDVALVVGIGFALALLVFGFISSGIKGRGDAAAKATSEALAASEAAAKTAVAKRVIADAEFQRKKRRIDGGNVRDDDFRSVEVEDFLLAGQARGRRAIYRLTHDGGTEVEVSRSAHPLFLVISPQSLQMSQDEHRVWLQGKAVYVVLGNYAPFDANYLVQGVPEAVVREAFDHDICVRVLAMRTVEVVTKPGTIQLALRRELETPGEVEDAIKLTLDIAARLDCALEWVVARATASTQGGAYRGGGSSGEAVDATLARAAEEVAALEALRNPPPLPPEEGRTRWLRTVAWLGIGLVMLLLMGAAVWLGTLTPHPHD